MNKIKKVIKEHKIFFVILLVAISLLGLEYIVVNTTIDKKTNPKKNKISNITSNVSDLSEKHKQVIGIDTSNENYESDKSSVTTKDIVSNKLDEKKEELTTSNVNKDYEKYEKLTDEEKNKLEVIPSKEVVSIDELDKIDTSKSNLPSKFDLNDKVTINYESQSPYGICWDFASSKVFETYMALNYNKNYNFSEIFVDYLRSNLIYNLGILHNGGHFDTYEEIVKRLDGLVETKYMNPDYEHDYTAEEYVNFFNYPRVKIEDYDVVKFPTIEFENGKKLDSDGNEISEETFQQYINAMKNHIMNNSAIYFSVDAHSKTIGPNYVKDNPPQGEYAKVDWTKAFFCEKCQNDSPHAMVLIGWDDNFDRRVFRYVDSDGKVHCAEHDGAFLVANSWEEEKVYYYISYDHAQLYNSLRGIKKREQIDTVSNTNLVTLNSKIFSRLNESLDKSDYIVENGIHYVNKDALKNVSYIDLTNLELTNNDLIDLNKIENLTYIDLGNNNITSIDFLTNFPNIEYLDTSGFIWSMDLEEYKELLKELRIFIGE